MSLTYDLTKTEWHKLPEDMKEQQWPVVAAIIQLTMVIGIGQFTIKTIDEIIARFRFYESLNGPLMQNKRGERAGLAGEFCAGVVVLRQLIGLTTNVSFETRGQFTKRITDNWYREQIALLHRDTVHWEQGKKAERELSRRESRAQKEVAANDH